MSVNCQRRARLDDSSGLLGRRTVSQIVELSVEFADAEMKNVAAMCRSIAVAKARRNRRAV